MRPYSVVHSLVYDSKARRVSGVRVIDAHFFFKHTATAEIYSLSLHDALPISPPSRPRRASLPSLKLCGARSVPILPTRSEEHTSELQSLAYLVCRLLLEK